MEEKPVPVPSACSAPYWEGAAAGRLLLQHCRACARYLFYPRPWCPHCFTSELQWRQVSGHGEVHTYSVVHAAACVGFESAVPYVLAVVQLMEGPRLMANIIGCAAEDVHVGLPVRVVFELRGKVHLPQFTPSSAA